MIPGIARLFGPFFNPNKPTVQELRDIEQMSAQRWFWQGGTYWRTDIMRGRLGNRRFRRKPGRGPRQERSYAWPKNAPNWHWK